MRKNQLLVKCFVRGSDVFASRSTGSEKSLCKCLLPIFSILQQINDKCTDTHTQTLEETRVNASTNHVTELTARSYTTNIRHD